MKYKGVEYTVVQMVDGTGWRWEVTFGAGKNKSGVTAVSRAAAIKAAEYEIDRVVSKAASFSLRLQPELYQPADGLGATG